MKKIIKKSMFLFLAVFTAGSFLLNSEVAASSDIHEESLNSVTLQSDKDRYVKMDRGEMKLLEQDKNVKGPSIKGESSSFTDYLNDSKPKADDDILIYSDSQNSKVVLGGGPSPAGLTYKMNFNETPLENGQ